MKTEQTQTAKTLERPERKTLSLKQAYILALSIILIVSTIKYALMETLVDHQSDSAIVINISGRQRMLSQRLAFYSVAFVHADSSSEREEIRPALLDTVDEFAASHNDLIGGNPERGLPKLENPAIYAVYFTQEPSLDALVDRYIESVRLILEANGSGEEAEQALDYILDVGPDVLLDNLDKVVYLHEKQALDDVSYISNLHKGFWILTFIVVLLEGLFLFRPMARRLEENILELKKRERKIQTQLREMQHFTNIASHDLQEPIRKIIGFTERLEANLGDNLDDKSKTYMGFITSGALHLRDLVLGLRTYSRISSAEDDLEELDSHKIVRQAIKELESKITSLNATIDYNNLPNIVYNRGMLIQVFRDLIDNALTYKADRNPVIEITAASEAERWVFCIADNGLGINEKYFESIFAMFHRLHRKEDIPGTGLGLAVVRKIVERHDGEIWVQSEEGSGSKFYFSVPKEL